MKSVETTQQEQQALLIQKGLALHQKGKFNKAQVFYEQVLVIQANNFDALQLLGALLLQTKQLSKAIYYFSKALQINPNCTNCYINLGNTLKELERFDEALASYDRAISIDVENTLAYFNRGNLLQELKRFEEAIESYNLALSIKVDYIEALCNRGSALQKLKRFKEALASYDKALNLKTDNIIGHLNRGSVLKELMLFKEALASYDKAIVLKSDYVEAYYNRGNTLQELNRLEEALESYDKAISIKPDFADAQYNRGNALQKLKRIDEAIISYEKALCINKNYSKTEFALASLGKRNTPVIMPIEIVIEIFDNYAERFDSHLVDILDYQSPTILLNQFKRYHTTSVSNILDLGCGTGLCGEAFNSFSKVIVGVDISSKMLEKAKEKKVYTSLTCSDIISFVKNDNRKFQLIICADVLVYIGDLKDLFQNIKLRLLEKGFFIFTIENSILKTYELKSTQRYGHNLSYIKDIARLNNLTILEIQEINVRKEETQYISGSAILMKNMMP